MSKIKDDSFIKSKDTYQNEKDISDSKKLNKKDKERNIFMDDDNQYVSAMLEMQSNIFKKIS